MRARSVACGARTRCAAGLALCLELFGCSNPKPRPDRPTPALRTLTEIAGEFTSFPEPFGRRCTAQKDAKQARTLVSCDAGEVLVMLPGLSWEVAYAHKNAIFEAYYRQPNSEGDDSPTTPIDTLARGLKINVFVADPQFNAFDAPGFLRERYERFASVDPEGDFYQFSKPEPWFDAEPPVLAFTAIENPDGMYRHSAVVTTVRRRADGRFVVYEVTQSVGVTVWGGPQPRYLLERIRDFPKSFWVFDRDGKQGAGQTACPEHTTWNGTRCVPKVKVLVQGKEAPVDLAEVVLAAGHAHVQPGDFPERARYLELERRAHAARAAPDPDHPNRP